MQHRIQVHPSNRPGLYNVSGACRVDSTATPIPDAARALKANGASDDDLVHVAGALTVADTTLGAILKPRHTSHRHKFMRELLGLPTHRQPLPHSAPPGAEHPPQPRQKVSIQMASFLMFPPIAVALQVVVANGRSYASTPGHAVTVPDMDAGVLAANGWVRVMLTGTTAQRPSSNPTVAPGFTAAIGTHYYDATIPAVVVFDGATWRGMNGASA